MGAGSPHVGRDLNAVYPNSWTWNLTLERELFRNTTLELSYVGTKQLDQLHFYDANQVAHGDINGNGIDDRLDFARAGSDTGIQASVRPYGVFGNTNIWMWGHDGKSNYHALQTQFVSRFGRGSQFQASYTWSKSTGTVPLDDSGGNSADNSVSDLSNRGLDWGPTKMNRPHIFNASLVLMLPSFENKSGFVRHVLGDWEIASIAAASSGQSITVYTNAPPGLSSLNGTGYSGNQRPMRVRRRVVPGERRQQGADPQPRRLHARRLPDRDDRRLGPRRLRRAAVLPGGPLALQEHQHQQEGEGPAAVRDVQRLQPRQLPAGELRTPRSTPLTATYDTGDPATATKITGYTPQVGFGQAIGHARREAGAVRHQADVLRPPLG